jgi:hypothetical protein
MGEKGKGNREVEALRTEGFRDGADLAVTTRGVGGYRGFHVSEESAASADGARRSGHASAVEG